uniref:Uncharacterized protein n=1 Tax=Myoviridae sp. ctZzC3 TaxID=2825130 RepID=A0A8S5Q1L6_9CAUD|nr:MAG TPA: hypothetical protein [Myoviridae sp. ctZzC3]
MCFTAPYKVLRRHLASFTYDIVFMIEFGYALMIDKC